MTRLPGAETAREAADYVLVGAPLDRSATGRPGARYGPQEIRRAGARFEDYDRDTDCHFSACGVHDRGDVDAWDDAADYLDYLEGVLAGVARDGAMPLVLGGEHTVSVAGVRAADPDVFVCCDAHLDLRESFQGNARSHATVTRHALDVADRAVIVGARAGSEVEWERAGADDVTVVAPDEAAAWRPAFDASADVYLSVDVDAADPSAAPGTGTPEPFGLEPATLRRVVREVGPLAAGFDVVEVTDRDDGQAAALAAKLLREFVRHHATA